MPSCAPVGVRSSEEPAIPSAFAAWQFAHRRFCASGERLTGAALTHGGISLPQFQGNYPVAQIHLTVCG